MDWGHGQLRGTEEQCLEAVHAPGRSRTTLKLTVLEDEFWVATVGRVSDIDRLEQSSGTELSCPRLATAPAPRKFMPIRFGFQFLRQLGHQLVQVRRSRSGCFDQMPGDGTNVARQEAFDAHQLGAVQRRRANENGCRLRSGNVRGRARFGFWQVTL